MESGWKIMKFINLITMRRHPNSDPSQGLFTVTLLNPTISESESSVPHLLTAGDCTPYGCVKRQFTSSDTIAAPANSCAPRRLTFCSHKRANGNCLGRRTLSRAQLKYH
ncbi:hypothetical protein J6590_002086 [Homalodisca vitripennis]|nr:hypothetical protein J6590_002086 [Homalodisca vitripennis]